MEEALTELKNVVGVILNERFGRGWHQIAQNEETWRMKGQDLI